MDQLRGPELCLFQTPAASVAHLEDRQAPGTSPGQQPQPIVGRRCRDYVYPTIRKKIDTESFTKPQDALKYIKNNITGDETLIFKGSQYLEWIIEKLLKNPEDVKKLCRQDLAHKKRRESWGLK